MAIPVVLYLPEELDVRRWAPTMSAWATRKGWDPRTHVRRWEDLVSVLSDGTAQIGVVLHRGHLHPDRLPRLEIMRGSHPALPGPRRPRRLWSPA